LLRDHIEELEQVTIDIEFPGREPQIKEHLINLLRRRGHQVEARQIGFRAVGKQSPAHKLALATFRGDREPDRIVREEELLGEF
jgi:hypothetical protein